jgi:hypothetical protein
VDWINLAKSNVWWCTGEKLLFPSIVGHFFTSWKTTFLLDTFFYLLCWNGKEFTIKQTPWPLVRKRTIPTEWLPSSLSLRPFIGLLYQPYMIDGDDCGATSGMNHWQGKLKYSEKPCPSATLYTRSLTWLHLVLNPDCHVGKPATKHLSHGTAY